MSHNRWNIHHVVKTPLIDECERDKNDLSQNEGNTNLVLEYLTVTKCKEMEYKENVCLIDEY